MNGRLPYLFCVCALSVFAVSGCGRPRPRKAPLAGGERTQATIPAREVTPEAGRASSTLELSVSRLRRAPTAEETAEEWESLRRAKLLRSGLRKTPVFVEHTSKGGTTVEVVLSGEETAGRADREVLRRLGFHRRQNGGGLPEWAREIPPDEQRDFRRRLLLEIRLAEKEVRTALAEFKRSWRAGALPASPAEAGENLAAFRLVYTGKPLDLALLAPHTEPKVLKGKSRRLFLAVEAVRSFSGLHNRRGETVFVHGGRLYVGRNGYLRTSAGALAGLRPLPPRAEALLLHPDGRVGARLPDGRETSLGHLKLYYLSHLLMNKAGTVFRRGAGGRKEEFELEEAAGKGRSPLLFGHLAYPAAAEKNTEGGGETVSGHRLREAFVVEQLLREVFSAVRRNGPVYAPLPPTGRPAVFVKGNQGLSRLVFFAEMPWSAAHLKALKQKVESEGGRLILELGTDAATRTSAVKALTTVLLGLRRKLLLHRENFLRAEEIREENGKPKPYRRRLLRLRPDGTLAVEFDPAPFPKKYKPDDKYADKKTGFVLMPNVDRSVEAAAFAAARAEFELLREALARTSPGEVFPSPPETPRLSAAGEKKAGTASAASPRPGRKSGP